MAAVADIHYTKHSRGVFQNLFSKISDAADVFLICGDSTDSGLPEEALILVEDLTSSLKIPIVAVLGNHDYESGRQDEIRNIFVDAGITVLDGGSCEIRGIGFAGIKGFAGGFYPHALQPWGEHAIKEFVRAAVEESVRLEAALVKLQTAHCVVLCHYSPIRGTIIGEHPEIFPFLGSSRMEETLNRYEVSAVFHGHAHNGTPIGRTESNIPVYNVSIPVLHRAHPDRPPFRLIELPRSRKAGVALVETDSQKER